MELCNQFGTLPTVKNGGILATVRLIIVMTQVEVHRTICAQNKNVCYATTLNSERNIATETLFMSNDVRQKHTHAHERRQEHKMRTSSSTQTLPQQSSFSLLHLCLSVRGRWLVLIARTRPQIRGVAGHGPLGYEHGRAGAALVGNADQNSKLFKAPQRRCTAGKKAR